MNANEIIPDDLISVPEAAKQLGVSENSIRRWVASGKIAAWKLVWQLRVSRADVAAMFTPVQPDNNRPRPKTKAEIRAEDEHTDKVLREAGIRK